ncbi:MAG: hypothetical protein MRY83_24795 [Flavobacteriales bacterium]|nr:hypothetical protein [Flavobacteriales bacterium]
MKIIITILLALSFTQLPAQDLVIFESVENGNKDITLKLKKNGVFALKVFSKFNLPKESYRGFWSNENGYYYLSFRRANDLRNVFTEHGNLSCGEVEFINGRILKVKANDRICIYGIACEKILNQGMANAFNSWTDQ